MSDRKVMKFPHCAYLPSVQEYWQGKSLYCSTLNNGSIHFTKLVNLNVPLTCYVVTYKEKWQFHVKLQKNKKKCL